MSITTAATLARLAGRLAAEGGLLEGALLPEARIGGEAFALGELAAGGPRAEADPEAFALVVEAAREAHLLHGGTSRILDGGDRDLAILAGDRLYALGLADLAALGAVDAVRELADVIALSAQARARADGPLAEAVWEGGAVAIGWGPTDAWERAKEAARAGGGDAPAALRRAADGARACTEVVTP